MNQTKLVVENGVASVAQAVKDNPLAFVKGVASTLGRTRCCTNTCSPCCGIAVANSRSNGRANRSTGHCTDGYFLTSTHLFCIGTTVGEIILVLGHAFTLGIDNGLGSTCTNNQNQPAQGGAIQDGLSPAYVPVRIPFHIAIHIHVQYPG